MTRSKKPDELRRLAGERLGEALPFGLPGTEAELRRLVHELQVHQVELELQNEELCRTREALEESRAWYAELYDFAPVGYFTLDRGGVIRGANLKGATLLGRERTRLVGRRFGALVAPEGASLFADFLERVFAGKATESCEVPLAPGAGRTLQVRIEAVVSEPDAECRAAVSDVTDQRRFAQAAEFLAACGAHEPGMDFFRFLARFLGVHLGMDYVCIDRLEEGNLSAQTVAVYFNGAFEDNVSYALTDTPCGDVVEKTTCSFPTGVRHLFPKDRVLQDMGAESYFGTTLFSHEGKPIGLIALIGRRPESNPSLVEAVLKLASIRAAAELDRARAEEALARAKDEAQSANRAKSAFLANMSHEIRTPLSAVVGMLKLLDGTSLDDGQRRYVGLAENSAYELLRLIDDILDFSKIEAGRLDFEEVEFSPRRVVEEAVGELSILARQKGLDLTLRVEPDVPAFCSGDPHRLRQVVVNLIGNAVKFTQEGGVSVRLGLDRTGQTCPTGQTSPTVIAFSVTDTGIGIPAEHRDRLFLRFSQADDSTTRAFGGTGLGLAISRQIVERMGGSIGFHSEEGRGSVFSFSIPCGVAPAGPRGEEGAAETLGEPAAPMPRPVRILVAEDEPVNREVTVTFLRQRGWQVTAVGDGGAAVEALGGQTFDVVLMDMQMPGVDGLAATRLIREREGTGRTRTPILGLTAHAFKGDRARCLEAGMDDCLAKPLEPEQLFAAVERWVRLSSSRPPAGSPGEGPAVRLLATVSPDRAQELRIGFRESVTEALEGLREALAAGNGEKGSFWAHRLRGSLVVFGFAGAAKVAEETETAASEGRLGDAAAFVAELEREISRVFVVMGCDLPQPPGDGDEGS